MRLIDADKLVKKERLFYSYLADEFYVRKSDIENAPTIEERKKGKWIKEPNCWYRCSHCGSHYPSIKDTMEYNYCPDCGADMREKEKTDGLN